MTASLEIWAVVLLSLAAANFPFVTDRGLGVFRLNQPKSLALRVLELVVCYVFAGGVGLLLEKRAGQIAPQTWEFYAITVFCFLTLAFPGFVYRYLLKRR